MLNDPEPDEKDQKGDHCDNDAYDDLFGQYDNITIRHSIFFKKTSADWPGGSACEIHHPSL